MKCSIKSILAVMAGVVMLGSCSDSDDFEAKSNVTKNGNMSFTVATDGAGSRASFTEDELSFMKPNSEISVFSYRQNNKFTMNDAGCYTGNCKESDEYYAVSPYSEKHVHGVTSTSLDKLVIYWNGAEQTLDLNDNYAPMMAHVVNAGVGAQNVPLVFKNICSYIKLTTDYSCKSITLKSRGGEMLAAQMLSVGYDETGNPHIYATAMPSETITLTGKAGGAIEAGTYYIPVLPGQLSAGVDITFTNKYQEKTYSKTFTNSGTLVCGEAIDLGTVNIKSEMIHLAGAGTETNPYLIHDFDQLVEMRNFVNNSTGAADCFKLVDDIDGNGAEFQPIGTFKKPYRGTFYGNHKRIKNLKLGHALSSDSKYNVMALFAVVNQATMKDVTIENMTFASANFKTDVRKTEICVASPFVGISICKDKNDGTMFKGITVDAKEYREDDIPACEKTFAYGGIVGASYGKVLISECKNYSYFYNFCLGACSYPSLFGGCSDRIAIFGGILGYATTGVFNADYNADVDILKCRNYGNIKMESVWYFKYSIGGILGKAYDETISDDVNINICSCVNFGSIEALEGTDPEASIECNLGGIVGNLDTDGYSGHDPAIANCINNGSINTSRSAGGIIGKLCNDNDAHITYCASLGAISVLKNGNPIYVGAAIVGNSGTDVEISSCYNNYNCQTAQECCNIMNQNTEALRNVIPDYFCKWKVYSGNNKKADLEF